MELPEYTREEIAALVEWSDTASEKTYRLEGLPLDARKAVSETFARILSERTGQKWTPVDD